MSLTYCSLFGLEEPQRHARLRMAGLDAQDRRILQVLHDDVLAWSAPQLAHAFALRMRTWPEYLEAMPSETDLVAFERRYTRFLLELSRALDDPRWFEERLRDSLGWARAGVSLGTYICAMGLFQRLVQDAVPEAAPPASRRAMQAVLAKLFTLDVSLGGDSYRLVLTDDFQAAVDALHAKLTADPLTGLSTRDHLLTALRLRLNAPDRPVCFVLADLDHFKRVNDQHGHLAGDAVLRQVASRIRSALREADLAGRLGGEEFAIVLDGTNLQGAYALAERVRECVAQSPCLHGELEIPVTLSQGIAESRRGDSIESLLDRADMALYAAKRAGRDRVFLESRDTPAFSGAGPSGLPAPTR